MIHFYSPLMETCCAPPGDNQAIFSTVSLRLPPEKWGDGSLTRSPQQLDKLMFIHHAQQDTQTPVMCRPWHTGGRSVLVCVKCGSVRGLCVSVGVFSLEDEGYISRVKRGNLTWFPHLLLPLAHCLRTGWKHEKGKFEEKVAG